MNYDVIYFVREGKTNEELRYSLRTVEKNFEYRNIWFIGGRPRGLRPDSHLFINQTQPTKWERTQNLLKQACKNEEISEEFYLFNDDFFIMHKWEYETRYNGDIRGLIERSEKKRGPNRYANNMKEVLSILQEGGYDTKNYAVHTPILINKGKALEILDRFPTCPMFRNLYGNYHEIGGVNKPDVKIMELNREPDHESPLLSTADKSFNEGRIGAYIREQFPERSKYEI